MKWTRYDAETQTHSTLSLEKDGWRLVVRRASTLVADRLVDANTAANCVERYEYQQVDE